MIITKKVVDSWKKKPPSCFVSTQYGEKKSHTSGRRETRLQYYSLHIVTAEKAATLSPFALAMRRTYTQQYKGGPLRRVRLHRLA